MKASGVASSSRGPTKLALNAVLVVTRLRRTGRRRLAQHTAAPTVACVWRARGPRQRLWPLLRAVKIAPAFVNP